MDVENERDNAGYFGQENKGDICEKNMTTAMKRLRHVEPVRGV